VGNVSNPYTFGCHTRYIGLPVKSLAHSTVWVSFVAVGYDDVLRLRGCLHIG